MRRPPGRLKPNGAVWTVIGMGAHRQPPCPPPPAPPSPVPQWWNSRLLRLRLAQGLAHPAARPVNGPASTVPNGCRRHHQPDRVQPSCSPRNQNPEIIFVSGIGNMGREFSARAIARRPSGLLPRRPPTQSTSATVPLRAPQGQSQAHRPPRPHHAPSRARWTGLQRRPIRNRSPSTGPQSRANWKPQQRPVFRLQGIAGEALGSTRANMPSPPQTNDSTPARARGGPRGCFFSKIISPAQTVPCADK